MISIKMFSKISRLTLLTLLRILRNYKNRRFFIIRNTAGGGYPAIFINKKPNYQQILKFYSLKLASYMECILDLLHKLMFNPKKQKNEQSRIS